MTKARIFSFFLLTGMLSLVSFAQTSGGKARNNPYSPSPSAEATTKPSNEDVLAKLGMQPVVITRASYRATPKIVSSVPSPTEIYRVGVGDVIFVNVKNSVNATGFYTVKKDGTLDFTLAVEKVIVTGKTAAEIARSLEAKITLYRDPRVEVSVSEFGSHKVTVSGLVASPGVHNIQREAIPLYVIRAGALVDKKATRAQITRQNGTLEYFGLLDAKIDEVLVFPGDTVEFLN